MSGKSGDAAIMFVINGAPTRLEAAVIYGVIRVLNKGTKIACTSVGHIT